MNSESSAEIQLENSVSRTKVDLTRLKAFAIKELPEDWPLRQILILEKTELDIPTFLHRLPLWIQLSNLKRDQR